MAGPISIAWTGPDELVRGVDTTLRAQLSRDGAALTVVSATVSVFRPDGTAIVTDAAATVATDTASYSVAASLYADDDPGDGWFVRWSIVAGSVTTKAQNIASLVLYPATLTATTAAMLKREDTVRNLRTDTDLATLLSDCLSEAWITICNALRQKGRRPYLVLSGHDLYEPTLLLALARAFRRCATDGEGSPEWVKADYYEGQYKEVWENTTFEEADPSTWKPAGTRRGTASSLWLGSGAGRTSHRSLTTRIR